MGRSENDILNTVFNYPYQLLDDLNNVKFKDIDEIARARGLSRYCKERLNQCFKHAMKYFVNTTKNTFITVKFNNDWNNDNKEYYAFWHLVSQYIDCDLTSPSADTYNIVNNIFSQLFNGVSIIDDFTVVGDNNARYIYSKTVFYQENGLAKKIASCISQKKQSVFCRISGCNILDIESDIQIYERKHHVKFDDSQKSAIRDSLMFHMSIINGGPGHGKTSVIDCILFIWSRHVSDIDPVLAAPTGRAVSVLKKATQNRYEVRTAMKCIHMMKQIIKEGFNQTGSEFFETLHDNLVVLDECSMIGVDTAFAFMSLFTDCQFIFVGDANQLPSISYGQFFRDLCSINLIIKNELVVNYRANGKLIVDNADAINKGDINALDYSDPEQFELVPAEYDFSNKIIEQYKKYVSSEKILPNGVVQSYIDRNKLKDTCVLCPTRLYSTGYLMLNKVIRDLVNPFDITAKANQNGYEIEGTYMYINENTHIKLRVGDRVVQTKNRADAECVIVLGKKRQESKGIFNGDTGVIKQCIPSYNKDNSALILLLDDGRETTVYGDDMKQLTLAYAMSIHKSQGCEYNNVIISAQPSLMRGPSSNDALSGDAFACRSLLYTAVTRAKNHVKIIGYMDGIKRCIDTEQSLRHSRLTDLINFYCNVHI